MDSMDYSYHDSSGASSNVNPGASWHPASGAPWPPTFNQHTTSSSQPSPGLIPNPQSMFPSAQEFSLTAFGYDFSEHLNALSSQTEPTMPQDLFYPPTPSHSNPTGPFGLSAHAAESASLAPQRDRGILFQSRNAARLQRHQSVSSSPRVQQSAGIPQRGQSMTTPRRPTSALRSRYAISQPSLDTTGFAEWEPPSNATSTIATPAVAASSNASGSSPTQLVTAQSATQDEQSSAALRNQAYTRQASQLTSYMSMPQPRLHAPPYLADRRRLIQHHDNHQQQHRPRHSASGRLVISEVSTDSSDQPPSSPRSPPNTSSSRRGQSSSGVTELQPARSVHIYRVAANRMVVPKWVVDGLEKVDVSELDEGDRTCVICYNDYDTESPEGNKEVPLRLPKCKHVFGSHCIRKWFEESDSCPYCRGKLRSEPRNPKGSGRAFMNLMRVRGWTGHGGTPEDIYRQLVMGESANTSPRNRRSVGERRPVPDNAEEQPRRTRQRLSTASDEEPESVMYNGFRVPMASHSTHYPRSGERSGDQRLRDLPTAERTGSSQLTAGNNSVPNHRRSSGASTRVAPTRSPRPELLTSVFNVPVMPNRFSNSSLYDSARRHASESTALQRQYSPRPDDLLPFSGEADTMDTALLNPLDRTPMPNQLGALPMSMMPQRFDPMWPLLHGREWI